VLAVSGDGFDLGGCLSRISVVRPDGTGLRTLTTGRGCGPERYGADWSADGRYVVFANGFFANAGNWPLGIMAADGSGARRIPLPQDGSIGEVLERPSLSPDGRNVVFQANRYSGVPPIFMARIDDGAVIWRQRGRVPRWSPDGRWIAYVAAHGRVALADALTGNVVALRRYPDRVYSVDWSPDSSRLLLEVSIGLAVARPWEPARDMRMIRRPRALPRRLIIGPGVWSPDGHRIAFAAYRDYYPVEVARASLWTMTPTGRHLHVVIRHTHVTDYCCIPDALSWQPLPEVGLAYQRR
jgi:Tol biopolymer transport system component